MTTYTHVSYTEDEFIVAYYRMCCQRKQSIPQAVALANYRATRNADLEALTSLYLAMGHTVRSAHTKAKSKLGI